MRDKTTAITLCLGMLLALMTVFIGSARCASLTPGTAVPFEFSRHEVLIQATINGQGPYPMLLDTGTSPSIIDLSLARRLGLPLTSASHSGSGGGTEKNLAYVTSLPSVGVGGLSAPNVDALALDLSALSRRFGRPIRGVLGDSLLSGRIVQFDYPARVVRFLPQAPSSASAQSRRVASVPFHHGDYVQISGVSINGKPVEAAIDTGSNSAFQITPRAVLALGLTAQVRRARSAGGAGFNGAYQSRLGTVNCIMVGPVILRRPQVTFWMPGTGHDDSPWDINIGNLFLQRYVLTLDYVRNRLTLDEPSK